jgi:hypothetical protein
VRGGQYLVAIYGKIKFPLKEPRAAPNRLILRIYLHKSKKLHFKFVLASSHVVWLFLTCLQA